jgi:RNA polymerase sigma factor (sigma-70 family)
MNPADEDSVRFIRPGNKAAVEALIYKYQRQLKFVAICILRKAMSFGAAEVEADGVLQEVYLDLWEKGIKNVEKTLANYLMGMVRYKAITRLRKRRLYVDLDETLEAIRVDLHLHMEFENRDRLERALSRLGPEDQGIIKLSYEGHTGKEMAIILDVQSNTARSKLNRARAKLLKILEEED